MGVMKDLPRDMEDMKKLPSFIMACYHGYQTMDCGTILPKLCPCLEHVSLTFEKISVSLGEATQFESQETIFCKENNMKLSQQQLFRKLGTETTVALMEMRKKSHSIRKKILVAIEFSSNALPCGKT